MHKSWEYWDHLASYPSSGIKLIRGSIYELCDRKVNDAKKAVYSAIQRRLNTYVPELCGILTGFKRLRVSSCDYLPLSGGIQYGLKGTFYVFVPQVGLELEGRITRKDKNLVSCLVHDQFSVDLQKAESLASNHWTQCKTGDVVKLRITQAFADGTKAIVSGELLSRIVQTPAMEDSAGRPKARRKSKSNLLDRTLDDLAFEILDTVTTEKGKQEKRANGTKLTSKESTLEEMVGKLLEKVTEEKKANKKIQQNGRKDPQKRPSWNDVPLEQLTNDIIQNVLLGKQPSGETSNSQKKRQSANPSLDDSVMQLLDTFAGGKANTESPKKKLKKTKTARSLKGKVKLNFSHSMRS